MNVLTFNLSEDSVEIIDIISKVKDVSLYFAFSADDMMKMANEIHPDLILIGDKGSRTTLLRKSLTSIFPETAIYQFKKCN